ncbi:MAG: TetR/AcrR family transcriptional regulator [Vicinamibacterales bacterium]
MSPRPRKASDAEVFAAAARVMGRVGPADLTLAAIAAEAGLTAGALVQRFGSKLALLRAMSKGLAGHAGGLAAELRAAHDSPLAALIAYARCVAGLAASPAALARNLAYLTLDLTDRHLYPALLDHARHTRAAYRGFLHDALAAGELDAATEVARLARTIETSVSGALMTWAVYREGHAADWIEHEVRAVLAPYLPGWRAGTKPPVRRRRSSSRQPPAASR